MRTITSLVSAAAVALLAGDVGADTITCVFTEPYVTITHDTKNATTVVSGFGIDSEAAENTGLMVVGVNTLVLSWQGRHLELTVDYRGSDQMSDQVYPFSARYRADEAQSGMLHGGCHSDRLPVIVPYDA